VSEATPKALYVYGVAAAAELGSISISGVQKVAVRTIEHDGLVALTSELEGAALAVASEVRAHWRVLDAASKRAAVLPARFGTVMESEEAVRTDLLEANAERLHELLAGVAGRIQLNVRGEYDEDKLLAGVVEGSSDILRLRNEIRRLPEAAGYYQRIQLGEFVAREVERRRELDTQRALETLGALAVEARREAPPQPYTAYKLAFLVERDAQDEFTRAVAALASEQDDDIEVRYVGPLPPYSFAEAELTTRSEAWA
jgi:hypothetical protein